MQTIRFELQGETIELCNLLKCAGVAGSSGAGKHMVALGLVTVDGQPESRKTAKIRAGQVVACEGTLITVGAAPAPGEVGPEGDR